MPRVRVALALDENKKIGEGTAMAGFIYDRAARMRFHAVTVVAGTNACEQAKALKDVRLLSVDAPRLPMRDCDRQDQCECRFVKHDDRRAGPRRREGVTDVTHTLRGVERRRVRGRRETDFE
jgi:hypothetical protein